MSSDKRTFPKEWGEPLQRTLQGHIDAEKWTRGYRFRDTAHDVELFVYRDEFEMMMELFDENIPGVS